MDDDRIEGAATRIGGKIKEGLGKLTGDAKLESDGKTDQAKGGLQNAWGGAKDTLRDADDALKR